MKANRTKVAAWVTVAFISFSNLTLAQQSSPTTDYTTLQTRLNTLEQKVALLSEQANRSNTQAQIESLQSELRSLYAELSALLDNQNAEPANYSVSEDALASRGGQLYVPPFVKSPDNGSLLNSTPEPLADAGLEISGFMDAVFQSDAALNHENDIYLNQVEVDFVKDLSDRANASLGVVYADAFDIGVAQISYILKPESDESSSLLKSWTVAAGQFDAPFGEDVQNYPSNVRKSITSPAIIEHTHNLWNDVGFQTNFDLTPAVVDMWLVRGFTLQSNAELDEPEFELNASCGSRVNFSLSNSLRLGGSSALGWLPDGSPAMQMYGAHAVQTLGSWTTTVEGLVHNEKFPGVTMERRGAYLQSVRDLGHFFALARGDYVEGKDFDLHRSLSIGGGAYLGSGLECRCEYKFNQSSPNQAFLQMVASF